MAYERRDFEGAAVATTLGAGITDVATSFTLASSTGWPDGSAGDFFARVESETIRCASRSGTTVTVASSGRGYEGTTAAAHALGVAVTHVGTKTDLDEANAAVYEVLGTGSAWTSYTPTLTNITIGNGTTGGRYLRQGKTVDFIAWVSFGSTTALTASAAAVSIPAAAQVTAPLVTFRAEFYDLSAQIVKPAAGLVFTGVDADDAGIYASDGDSLFPLTSAVVTVGAGDVLVVKGRYEAA